MPPHTTAFARTLRIDDNPAERALWSALKGRQLGGYKFTRQFPIGPYFADFACRSEMLAIELDGSQHHDAITYDQRRDDYMLGCGYSVLRVPSVSALHRLQGLCDTILAAIDGTLDDRVDADDMMFRRSHAKLVRRGLNSRGAVRHSAD